MILIEFPSRILPHLDSILAQLLVLKLVLLSLLVHLGFGELPVLQSRILIGVGCAGLFNRISQNFSVLKERALILHDWGPTLSFCPVVVILVVIRIGIVLPSSVRVATQARPTSVSGLLCRNSSSDTPSVVLLLAHAAFFRAEVFLDSAALAARDV